MDEKVEIKKVVLKIGKKEIELSLSEAKELQELLNETFGKATVISSPIIIERDRYHPYPYWHGTYWSTSCDSSGKYTITSNISNMNS
jgi:hypothetical protein